MTGQIKRAGDELALALKTALAGSTPFDFRPWAGARIDIPAGSSITSLTFYQGPSRGKDTRLLDPTTFIVCQDVAAMNVAAGKSYELPVALYACHALVILVNVAGDVTIYTKG